jgi:threonine dehydrogenase-like Zn-dependent dehydrogenase
MALMLWCVLSHAAYISCGVDKLLFICGLLQIECTGDMTTTNKAINYVRRKGTLCLYGIYVNGQFEFPPSQLVMMEIKVSCRILILSSSSIRIILQLVGFFSQSGAFPRAIEYIESGRVNVKGMVRHLSCSIVDCGNYILMIVFFYFRCR